ncbi:DUF1905 domain-containing protein [Homoserinibacter sp. YIM 151385]|uniref:DUF1905 domain-containing protein n=1 Tax=Homoserinibacter sp. YIM 151385 TaxID=2985506 RepID=UPI0022F02373|nr:DUF1905 domain-containing protein [Homoserinibacter sp. YIM 151385]WBU38560.1 DUF1905 domain-containing protein [Homoserinibacter sp. YIM 151385]
MGDPRHPEGEFDAELWLWEARREAWTFVTLPPELGEAVRDAAGARPPAGFGAVPVEVSTGTTSWRTSVFPDAARGSYVLPVKAAVRRAEGLEPGASARYRIRVR